MTNTPSLTTWSELSRETQDSIIRRLDDGEDRKTIADEYSLEYQSFARTMRRIRAKRKNRAKQELISYNQEHLVDITRLPPFQVKHLTIHIQGDTGLGSDPNERTLFINTERPLNILYFTDAHFPFHDPMCTDAFIRACEKLPHDIIINGGDTLDLYGLSRYGKDPSKTLVHNLKQERAAWKEFALRVNKASPHSEKFNIFGNHLYRYMVWLHDNPSIMAMDEMQIDAIMQLQELKWHINVSEILFNADYTNLDYPDPEFIAHHGTVARKHAGVSSRSESENMGYISSISGHVHRLSASYKKTLSTQVLMAEGGTLRNLRPDYMRRPDWQNGFQYLTYVPGQTTFCTPVLIYNGNAYYNGCKI